MKHFKVFGIVIAFVVLLVGQGYAQNAGLKIAYVDLGRVFDEYSKTKEYDAVLTKFFEQ